MNSKQCKKIRVIANTKAISWKETTNQDAKTWKSAETPIVDPRTSNVQGDVFFQRKLHPLSVGAIAKKLKRLFKVTSRCDRNESFNAFEYMMSSHPELLGIPSNK